MKPELLLCLALILSGCQLLKAADQPYVVTPLDAKEITKEIPEVFSGYHAIADKNVKLLPEEFAVQTKLGWITAAEYKRLKLSKGETHIHTPLGSKALSVIALTDATREEMKAQIVVFQDGRPRWQFDLKGCRNLDIAWIDEKALKIVYWPGTRVRVTELINAETGKIIYRSADGIYDNLEPQSSASKK